MSGLLLDLESVEFWIDKDNPAFEDTPYNEGDWRIKVEPLNRAQLAKTRRDNTQTKRFGREETREDLVDQECFIQQVKGWESIYVIDGKTGKPKLLPYSEDNKKLIAREMTIFANLVNSACLNVRRISSERLEEEAKNSPKSGAGG